LASSVGLSEFNELYYNSIAICCPFVPWRSTALLLAGMLYNWVFICNVEYNIQEPTLNRQVQRMLSISYFVYDNLLADVDVNKGTGQVDRHMLKEAVRAGFIL
jgi:hypothetical protein